MPARQKAQTSGGKKTSPKTRTTKTAADYKEGTVPWLRAKAREEGIKLAKGDKKADILQKLGMEGVKTKKKRSPKDPNAPKRPPTAYLLFSNAVRNKVKAELESGGEKVSLPEVSKETGERWRKLSAKEKKKYEDQHAKLMEPFEQEMAKYKAEKEKNAKPKKSLTAFFLFSNDHRAEVKKANPDLPVSDIAKEMGKKWKAVKPAQKKKYEELAAKEKQKYEKALEKWKKEHPEEETSPKKKSAKKTSPKKSPTKKTSPKKTSPKKTSAKKTPTKKTAPKKKTTSKAKPPKGKKKVEPEVNTDDEFDLTE